MRGAGLPAHVPVKPYTHEPTPKQVKPSKYRAEPCIVTADLTLFTRPDIWTAYDQTSDRPDITILPLKKAAKFAGIIGEWFGSLKEGRRYIELKQMEVAGAIQNLRCQVPYECRVNETRLGEWRADFVYVRDEFDGKAPQLVVEDVKGKRLPFYIWKKAHVEAQFGITITEL